MQTPDRLGKYLIRRELGRGAMGIVYEGFDPLIERTVAIKVLRLDEANAELAAELRLRFRREAQAAGRLSHPNIVSVYEYGEEAGTNSAFIAMELVEGHDLKSIFDAGKQFSLADTGRIMGDLLGALQHAHERGVVHRDIKPANIILLDDGGVKVADFGIAKLDTSELTQLGSVLGTVSHMSPEQLTGEAVDRRSDLFSCGVILYQLLTGARAFTGSPATVMHKVLHEQPPAPSELVATLPRALDDIVRKAMAKAPAGRYAGADVFAAALRPALAGGADSETTVLLPQTPAPARPGGSRGPLVGALAAVVLLAAGAGAYLMPKGREPAPLQPQASASASTSVSTSASLPANAAPSAPALSAAASADPPPSATAAPALAVAPNSEEIEQAAWDDALKANSGAAYEAYLKGYPQGRFAARARIRLAALAPKPASAPTVSAAAPLPKSPAAPPSSASLAKAPERNAAAVVPRPEARPVPPPPAEPAKRAMPLPVPVPERPPAPARNAARPGPDCADEARRGNARCQVVLGNLYRSGNGVARDPAEALRWFRKAADQGYSAGQYELGTLFESGLAVPRDTVQAVGWYRKAADQGYAPAQNRLGVAYEGGSTGPPNFVLAADWYRKAADQGQAFAQMNLGRLYLRGRGVFKDTAKAAELFQKASEQGEPNAQFLLGWMYEKGDGKPRDPARAARLYREALASPALAERNRQAARAFLASKP